MKVEREKYKVTVAIGWPVLFPFYFFTFPFLLSPSSYFLVLALASMLSVACGTARSRSLGMSLPVSRQMP